MNKSISVKTKISILFALLLLFVMAVAIATANANEFALHEPTAQIAQVEVGQEFVDSVLVIAAENVSNTSISKRPARSSGFVTIDGVTSSRGYGWSD